MSRLSETHEQFDERQRRMNEAYKRFVGELTALEADLILSDLTFEGIKAIIGSDADRGTRWLDMLLATPDRNLRHLHHVALQVAIALSDSNISSVPDFVTRVLALDPTIRRVTGPAKISVAAVSLWSNAISPAMVNICKRRLQTPRTDSDIASEVMAAHLGGKV
ncbi:hypothetical protein OMK64_20350, partial [Cellulomonas fimi]|uniref:hypothetical protein n=1 Tax=Cellulomonas fimi TaxID=1708 RepID=UPI00234C177E